MEGAPDTDRRPDGEPADQEVVLAQDDPGKTITLAELEEGAACEVVIGESTLVVKATTPGTYGVEGPGTPDVFEPGGYLHFSRYSEEEGMPETVATLKNVDGKLWIGAGSAGDVVVRFPAGTDYELAR